MIVDEQIEALEYRYEKLQNLEDINSIALVIVGISTTVF